MVTYWVCLVEAASFTTPKGRRCLRGQRFSVPESEVGYFRAQGTRFTITPVRESTDAKVAPDEVVGRARSRRDVRERKVDAAPAPAPEVEPEVESGGDGESAPEGTPEAAPAVDAEPDAAVKAPESTAKTLSPTELELATTGIPEKVSDVLKLARALGVSFDLKTPGRVTKAERAEIETAIAKRQNELLSSES